MAGLGWLHLGIEVLDQGLEGQVHRIDQLEGERVHRTLAAEVGELRKAVVVEGMSLCLQVEEHRTDSAWEAGRMKQEPADPIVHQAVDRKAVVEVVERHRKAAAGADHMLLELEVDRQSCPGEVVRRKLAAEGEEVHPIRPVVVA